jgi:hypothetical protein
LRGIAAAHRLEKRLDLQPQGLAGLNGRLGESEAGRLALGVDCDLGGIARAN